MSLQVLLVFQTRLEECTAMLKGITSVERRSGWKCFLDDEAYAETDPKWLCSNKWDGVISRHTTPAFAATCLEMRLPLVDINDTPPIPGVPKIRPDNISIGQMGAEHLMERGYRHYGFCGFSNNAWACERRDGFAEALGLAGHRCEVLEVDYPGGLTPFWEAEQIAAIGSWLVRLPRPVAVMACNDLRALQVLAAAQLTGLIVPEEVAVLGVNNDCIRCELADPPLSSVATNAFHSGYRAAELLAKIMRDPVTSVIDQRVDPLGVVTRRSTDALAIQDKHMVMALSFIRENADQGVTVKQVLKHSFASRSQLEKRFRQYLGWSPQVEIRRVQVARVRQLLTQTDYPLKKIAEATGFDHVEYMSVVFKRLTGASPGCYRKKVQAKSI